MYVGTYLISNKNYKIDRKSIPRDEGPDFVLENGEWMECVACTWGHNLKLPYSDGLPHDYPKDEIQLRITDAFSEKKQQYIRWNKKKWFDKGSPYILFINTYLGRLNNNAEIYKILYGIGGPYAVVQRTKEAIKIVDEGTTEEKHLMKNNNTEVPKDLFKNLDYQFISAVVFSNNHVINYFDPIGDDLRVIYNPMATNKCELSDIKEYRKGPSGT